MTPTRYVDAHYGTRLAVYEEGDPDGPTVVLVHGWPDSHTLWDGVVSLLAERHRVIRYDNRGAGASDVPGPVEAYAISRLADDFGYDQFATREVITQLVRRRYSD